MIVCNLYANENLFSAKNSGAICMINFATLKELQKKSAAIKRPWSGDPHTNLVKIAGYYFSHLTYTKVSATAFF